MRYGSYPHTLWIHSPLGSTSAHDPGQGRPLGAFAFCGGAPVKAAILIDGGYFLKRLGSVRRDVDMQSAEAVDKAIGQLVDSHLKQLNEVEKAGNPYSLLYRCFFYDALPYMEKGHMPVSGKAIDYAKSDQAKFRLALFDLLRRRANFAVRLGQVRKERTLQVRIPAGVDDGSRIRLAGEGDAGARGGPRGDLYIFLGVTPHELFERDGLDLHCTVPVPMTVAALGGEIEAPCLMGGPDCDGTCRIEVKVPEGSQTGRTVRLIRHSAARDHECQLDD